MAFVEVPTNDPQTRAKVQCNIYVESTNEAANQSTVRVIGSVADNNPSFGGFSDRSTWSVSFQGVQQATGSIAFDFTGNSGRTYTFYSNPFTVGHNANGTASATASVFWDGQHSRNTSLPGFATATATISSSAGTMNDWVRPPSTPAAPTLARSSNGSTLTITGATASFNGSSPYYDYRISRDNGASWYTSGILDSNRQAAVNVTSTDTLVVQTRAIDSEGAGSYSASSNSSAGAPFNPSLNVSRTGLIYTISGSSTINSGSVSSYRFSSRSSTNGGSTFTDWSAETTLNGSTYSTTFASSAATTYQFRVRAVSNNSIFSDYNSSGNFHTPNVPLIPSSPIVLTKNVKKVNIDWDTFRTNANTNSVYNGAVIVGHQIQFRYSGDKGSTWTNFEALTPIGTTNASTTFILTENLLVAKTYEFRILATSDVGNSAYQTSPQIFVSAYGSRATGPTTFLPIENAKIFLGIGQPGADAGGWRTIENVRKFDGTWKDLET
jgi:hypothetical protein